MRRRVLLPLTALIVVAALTGAGCGAAGLGGDAAAEVASTQDRDAASGFSAPDLDGPGEVSLSAYRGKPVVVNFWASWCTPCREEMPAINAFAKANPDVQVVGIAVNDDPAESRRFARKVKVSYPLATDEAGTVAGSYGVQGLPTTVVIDAAGRVATVWAGPIDRADLERITARLS